MPFRIEQSCSWNVHDNDHDQVFPKGISMKLSRNASVLTLPFMLVLALLNSAASAIDKPVKVYILSGQSNMVGIGQVTGGGSRWGSEFIDPVVSVYPGNYDPGVDYDQLDPTKTVKLESFGGVNPTPYPGGGTQIVRGFIQIKTSGEYEFRPGYGASTNNLMEVDGKEVYRQEPGQGRGSYADQADRRPAGPLQDHLPERSSQRARLDRSCGHPRHACDRGQARRQVSRIWLISKATGFLAMTFGTGRGDRDGKQMVKRRLRGWQQQHRP